MKINQNISVGVRVRVVGTTFNGRAGIVASVRRDVVLPIGVKLEKADGTSEIWETDFRDDELVVYFDVGCLNGDRHKVDIADDESD
jgi:hypothetical protein